MGRLWTDDRYKPSRKEHHYFFSVLPAVLVPRASPHAMDHIAIKSEFKSPSAGVPEHQFSPGSQSDSLCQMPGMFKWYRLPVSMLVDGEVGVPLDLAHSIPGIIHKIIPPFTLNNSSNNNII